MVCKMVIPLNTLLCDEGYKLVEDAWVNDGRRTYMHDENATRPYITQLYAKLQALGWQRDSTVIRCFRHPKTKEIVEVEPGGSEVDGHFLHHMKDQA